LATPDYLQVMGIPLLQGRFFTEQDRTGGETVVVVDDVFAKRVFGDREAVGERLWLQVIGLARVVGVVSHVRHWGLDVDDKINAREQMYLPFAQLPDSYLRLTAAGMSLAIRTTTPPLNIVEAVRSQVRGATRDQAIYEVRSLEQIASATLARKRFLLLLFSIFAGLALLLACIGIYGVLAYLTSQRVPEFGVRMALGATARDVMGLVLGQSLGMIFIGIGVGLAAAVAASRLLERFVPGVRPADLLTFAIMISVLILAALFASFLPARRASRIDPMNALRQE
jgi:predicted permease